jgi:hypothetical protein
VNSRRVVALLAIATLAVASCASDSDDSDASDAQSNTTTTAASATRPEVTITATDYAFDMPLELPAGYVDVTLVNNGTDSHHANLVRLDDIGFNEFRSSAVKTDVGAVVDTTTFVGGPNGASPNGGTATSIVKLEPGDYAVVCFIPAADGKTHAEHGMTRQVKVVETPESVNVAPEADATIDLAEFKFNVPTPFDGKGTFAITNPGSQVHEAGIVKLADGKTIDDAKDFFLATDAPTGPPPFTDVNGTVGISNGETTWLDLDLEPGQYVLYCFYPDPGNGNLPHALEGMFQEIQVPT